MLGAILLDPQAITRVLDFLQPEDFYRENHRQIYRSTLRLFEEGEPIDNITVAAELQKLGVLDRIGGRAQLAVLQESVPTAANAEYYARIVKEKAYKRRLIEAGGRVAALGYDAAIEADAALNEAQASIYAIADDRIRTDFERLYDLLKPAMDRIDAQMATGSGVVGVPSGFLDLDRLTNGFKASDLVIVAGRPSMGKCLRANSLVVDPATGERLTIEAAVQRRQRTVMGVSMAGELRAAEVADWVDSGVKPCWRVTTRTGHSVEVTGHHPFLTIDGWQPLHDLVVGDSIAAPSRLACFGSDASCTFEQVRAVARALMRQQYERFPAHVWRWDRPRLAELVKAMLGGDGGCFTAGSEDMVADLQHALLRLGTVSRISRSTGPYWTLETIDRESMSARRMTYAGTIGAEDQGQAPGRNRDRRLSTPEIYWDEITAIEATGEHQVYDLTVPDGSNFIAQDIVVHNTSWALNVALHAAVDQKVPVAIFSLEMSKEQLVERLLCSQAKIDSQRMHRGLLSEAEHERLAMALGPLGDAPIFIDESPSLDELTLLLKARQIKMRENIGMIIVDYLQLMQGRHRGDDSNRVQEVSQISRSMKALARELKVPVIAVSQLSRAPEQRPDKRPILSDLRESGSIEQDADVVLFIFRPEYYKPEEKPGRAEVIIAKHRNGPTGMVELLFRRDQTLFYNLEARRPEPEEMART